MNGESGRIILEEIRRRFATDDRLRHAKLDVEVVDGSVTLSGSVDGFSEKLVAEAIAHRTKNVRLVVSELVVHRSADHAASDAGMRLAIEETLASLLDLDDCRIAATVSNGVVVLQGIVDSRYHRDLVREMIGQVAGVRAIVNMLAVGGGTSDVGRRT